MNPIRQLRAIGQSLWLDYITRGLLTSGTLRRYLSDLSVTGLTSNPTIFDQAISRTDFYDAAIRRKSAEGRSGEELFFELALEDLGQAADLFRPIHDQTEGADGWVSLEVSPLLAYDTRSTIAAAQALHARAGRFRDALAALRIAAGIDLEDLTGSTASGVHLATMGGLWQALAFGFAGVRPRDGVLGVDPHLPPEWGALELRLRFQGYPLGLRIDHADVALDAGPELHLHRREHTWEVHLT